MGVVLAEMERMGGETDFVWGEGIKWHNFHGLAGTNLTENVAN